MKDNLTTQPINTDDVIQKPFVAHGWVCPKCGAVMAPWKSECSHCVPTYPYSWPTYPTYPNPIYPTWPVYVYCNSGTETTSR